MSIGLAIEQKHTNSRGICHGGVLATLADLALGYAMLARSGDKGSFVTAHLAVDYAGAARKGDWVESSVEIQRVGARLAFANCYLVAGGRPHRARKRDLRPRREERMNEVVLTPGLWMPGVAMRLLAARLAQRGYRVHIFDYRGRAPFDANVEAWRALRKARPCFVGHSLGGVLVLEMLNRHPEVAGAGRGAARRARATAVSPGGASAARGSAAG